MATPNQRTGTSSSASNTPISEHMSPAPHSIRSTQSLAAAHKLMRSHRLRHLPVLDAAGRLVGIVSERDLYLLETFKDVDAQAVQVEAAMTSDIYAVSPGEPLGNVVREMARNKNGCALVVESGNVVGIFTAIDALQAFAEQLGRT